MAGFGQTEAERAPLAFFTMEDDRPTLRSHDLFSHKQSQTGAVGPGFLGVRGAVKLCKQMEPRGLRHARIAESQGAGRCAGRWLA